MECASERRNNDTADPTRRPESPKHVALSVVSRGGCGREVRFEGRQDAGLTPKRGQYHRLSYHVGILTLCLVDPINESRKKGRGVPGNCLPRHAPSRKCTEVKILYQHTEAGDRICVDTVMFFLTLLSSAFGSADGE